MASDPIEPQDPHLDDLTDDELAEVDPAAAAVAGALDEWYTARCCCRHHMVGSFLELLALAGYEVTERASAPELADLLPPAVD